MLGRVLGAVSQEPVEGLYKVPAQDWAEREVGSAQAPHLIHLDGPRFRHLLDDPQTGAINTGHHSMAVVHQPCSQRQEELAPGHCPLVSLFGVPPLTHP